MAVARPSTSDGGRERHGDGRESGAGDGDSDAQWGDGAHTRDRPGADTGRDYRAAGATEQTGRAGDDNDSTPARTAGALRREQGDALSSGVGSPSDRTTQTGYGSRCCALTYRLWMHPATLANRPRTHKPWDSARRLSLASGRTYAKSVRWTWAVRGSRFGVGIPQPFGLRTPNLEPRTCEGATIDGQHERHDETD